MISLAFDEITAITADRISEETYNNFKEVNRQEYKKICDDAIEYALVFLEELQDTYGGTDFFFDKRDLPPEKIIEKVLDSYNPVTGYLYEREAKRKEARLKEGMMAGKQANDRDFYGDTIRTNTNLWYTQTKQYAEDIADQTVIEVWKKAGVKKIMWLTEEDERVCNECRPLDRKIFDIDKVPSKPHYRCRCKKVPVIVEDNNTAR